MPLGYHPRKGNAYSGVAVKIAMIPARMGSQRLKKKNLIPLNGIPIIRRAVRRCQEAGVFDKIFINSENIEFKEHAEAEGAFFHQRPEHLGNSVATSEDFIEEFLQVNPCDRLYQVHSISPLCSATQIKDFVEFTETSGLDTVLSCVEEQIECAMNGTPVNFTLDEKTNSQELTPIQRITWTLSSWRGDMFLDAKKSGGCATYSGKVGFMPLDRWSGHIIKKQEDMDIAEAMLAFLGDGPDFGG